METLNEAYANISYDDNTIIMCTLNTILNENHKNTLKKIKHFIKLFEDLLNTSIYRADIKYIVDKVNNLENNNTVDNYIKLVKEIYKLNLSENYKYLFLMCYCRSLFEIYHNIHITYKKPIYALNEAYGEPSWSVFLDSLEHNDYIYI